MITVTVDNLNRSLTWNDHDGTDLVVLINCKSFLDGDKAVDCKESTQVSQTNMATRRKPIWKGGRIPKGISWRYKLYDPPSLANGSWQKFKRSYKVIWTSMRKHNLIANMVYNQMGMRLAAMWTEKEGTHSPSSISWMGDTMFRWNYVILKRIVTGGFVGSMPAILCTSKIKMILFQQWVQETGCI